MIDENPENPRGSSRPAPPFRGGYSDLDLSPPAKPKNPDLFAQE